LTREFHLSPPGKGLGVSCDAEGAFVGAIPILNRLRKDGRDEWHLRDCEQLSEEISEHYGLPVDMSSKTGGLKAIANALNRGDVARAQIGVVLLGIPDPPTLSKGAWSRDQMIELIRDLHWSKMINWDLDDHPRWPAGSDDSIGGRFAPKDEGAETASLDGSENVDGSGVASRDPRTQLADAGVNRASDDPAAAAARAAMAHQRSETHRAAAEPTAADRASFGPLHYKEAQQLAAKLGHGATAQEFLALSSVESNWGIADAAKQANNFFGIHNVQEGPFAGQTGTYVTSGAKGIPGSLAPQWLPPNTKSNSVQNVAAFPPETGYLDSGDVVVATLLRPKVLAESGGDYSDPAVFFTMVHKHGWGEGTRKDYVHVMLQRIRYF